MAITMMLFETRMTRMMATRHRHWLGVAAAFCLDGLRRGLMRISIWRWRAYSRRALGRMERRALRDIGLTEVERDIECRKRFWEG